MLLLSEKFGNVAQKQLSYLKTVRLVPSFSIIGLIEGFFLVKNASIPVFDYSKNMNYFI